jgi:hypothetical protein
VSDFYELVQKHERVWGTENYKERPDLADIVGAVVVVFWLRGKEERPYITLHNDLQEIEEYMTKLLFRSMVDPPEERVVRVYQRQRQVRIKNVRIEFEEVTS